MVQVVQLGALVLGLGWLTADIHFAEKSDERVHGPEWRRTSQGWIKVGHAGAAALDRPIPQPAAEPALHPGIVAIFMLLSGVLSLSLFEQRPSRAPMPCGAGNSARRPVR